MATRPAWTFVGIAAASLLAATAIAALIFLLVGQRLARGVRAQSLAPALRAAEVRERLPGESWPRGYQPALGITVPLLGRVAVLESAPTPLGPGDEAGPRKLFIYLERSGSGPSGRGSDHLERLLDLRGLEIERGGPVANGKLESAHRVLVFRTIRARLQARPRGSWSALIALVDVRCPGDDETLRFGAWIEPDPSLGLPPPEAGLEGTPADPRAIREFMAAFRICAPS